MVFVAKREADSVFDADAESGVRLRSSPGRYVVEVARLTADSTVLDFEADYDSDDIEECEERVAELRQLHGDAIVTIIWDRVSAR